MSAISGITDAEVVALVTPLRPSQPEVGEAAGVFARATWSGLAEPGDRVAGLLRQVLGAMESLNVLIRGLTSRDIAAELVGRAEIDIDHDDLVDLIGEGLERWQPRLRQNDAKSHLQHAAQVGVRYVVPEDSEWPITLNDLAVHAPPGLWVRSATSDASLSRKAVSVVGARASTGYGEHVTADIVAGLVDQRWAIVSGAAYGIDGMAHRATLASDGLTVAVLAGGVDRLYPSGHDTLLRRIVDRGAVISELPCGFAPTKWRFLQRNRLIAALGSATVVVEAGWRSGSLNTAHHALGLDRPVGAVPGPVTSPSSAGCHRLLRDTPAVCVTDAREVIELTALSQVTLSPASGSAVIRHHAGPEGVTPHHPELGEDLTRLIDVLSVRRARTVDEVARVAGMSPANAEAGLGLLSLDGHVSRSGDGWLRVHPTERH